MGFTISYAAVTWTAGDVITEAKMDNMVANDQAYDSHSAQGFEIDEMSKPSTPAANKIRIYAKDKSGVSTLYYLKDDGTEIELGQVSNINGWIDLSSFGTFTYASATTINTPVDLTAYLQIGDKFTFTQHGTVKYFYITAITSSLITVLAGTNFAVENTATYAITLPYFSHQENPVGFPKWFAFTPTISTTANAGTFDTTTKFRISGGLCQFRGRINYANALASGNLTISLPISLSYGALCIIGGAHYFDQGVADKQCFVNAVSTSTIYFPLTDGSSSFQGGAVTSATWNVNDWVDWVCSYPCF